jgi:hypothetical protein
MNAKDFDLLITDLVMDTIDRLGVCRDTGFRLDKYFSVL